MRRPLHRAALALLLQVLSGALSATTPLLARTPAPRVIARLDPPKILIGQETTLEVRVSHPAGANVELILPADTLVTGVEIKQQRLADSVMVTETLREYIYRVTLTSFDSADYRLDHITAMVSGDLYRAEEPPILMVSTLPVDAEHPEKFADIKGQWRPDFVWSDYLSSYIALLLFVLLCVAGYFLWRRYRNRPKPEKRELPPPVPEKDPYREAMDAMQSLLASDLLETNRQKEYYTILTDILRRYIYRVYGIETAEKTSSEILTAYRRLSAETDTRSGELERILETADYAKFAKYAPTDDENAALWHASADFVEETHRETAAKEEAEKGGTRTV